MVNIVTGFGKEPGNALVCHPHVDKIAFTGSTATATTIARAAALRHVRVSLELGGKSPKIIFYDANLDAAIQGISAGIFAATGQSRNAGLRVLVQARIHDEVAERLARLASELKVGDPLDAQTQLGPLASGAQFDKVSDYLEVDRGEGFCILAGGNTIERRGYFVEATIFDNLRNDSRIAREEIFGSVASLIRFDDEEEAIAVAN